MDTGRQLRLDRFKFPGTDRGLVIPMDHGLTIGPVDGLRSINQIRDWIRHPSICGVVVHKGMAERLAEARLLTGRGVMVHLNGMTTLAPDVNLKAPLTSVEAALRLGADGVSLQVNFDGQNDRHNLELVGQTADEAHRCGLPLLTMLYDKVPAVSGKEALSRQKHLIRICVELGTDAIKLGAPDDFSTIPELLDGVADHTAIYFAGGALGDAEAILQLASATVRAKGAGLCFGRNVFQRPNAGELLRRIERTLREEI